MPRVTSIDLIARPEQPVISLRTRTTLEGLPRLIGESFMKMGSFLRESGEHPSDIPFVAYYNQNMSDLDVEIGFPIAKALATPEGFDPGSIPAGLFATCIHRGPHREIEPVYIEMMAWIAQNGFTLAGPVRESYYNGPCYPEEELLTRITLPVQKAD